MLIYLAFDLGPGLGVTAFAARMWWGLPKVAAAPLLVPELHCKHVGYAGFKLPAVALLQVAANTADNNTR